MTKEIESFEDGLGLIPYGGEILSGVVKVWDFASSFGQEDPQKYENEWLQKQIDVLKEYVKDVNQSLNELRARLGHDENMTRLSWLELYTGDTAGMAGDIRFRLSLRPIDADERKILAHQAFGLAAKFLLQDPLTGEMADIWKWTTLHEVRRFHDDNTAIDLTVDALDADFKVALVLPIYAYVLILCIATIDLDTGGDWVTVRERYGAELERHIAQTDPTPGVPWSLADQIRARVSCVVEPDNIYADAAGQCVFYFGCKDLMAHTIDFKQRPPVSMTVPVRGSNVMCQYPSDSVEAKSAEEEFQDARGVQLIRTLNQLLTTVYYAGSLRPQFVGQFVMTPVLPTEFLYGIKKDGSVDWFQQEIVPEGETAAGWNGPLQTRTGWEIYSRIFPAGGNCFYALTQSGELHWFQHDDFNNGGPGWTGPRELNSGWDVFTSIIPGGNGVLYAVQPDGTLLWYLNAGEDNGSPDWIGGSPVGSGWNVPARVFSVGDGVLYAVAADGSLWWWRHLGFEKGDALWDGPNTVGSGGWQDFRDIFGAYNGVIYAVQPDGVVRQYVHLGWETGDSTWRAPVTAAFNVGSFRQVVALLPNLFRTPH
jgi:hypothetical protein